MSDLVVVGGGIAGLAAAWEARRRGADVVLLEASGAAGGKLRTSPVVGVPLDESADAFLARVPEAVELCRAVGLGSSLVAPTAGRAYVWVEGALRALPADQLLGVPTDLDAVAETGILSAAGVARAREDLVLPDDRPAGDEAVGGLVRRRLGDEVLDRLVAPLVGGIWAADCDQLSLGVATPQLAAARDRDPSLLRGAIAVREAGLAAAAAGAGAAGVGPGTPDDLAPDAGPGAAAGTRRAGGEPGSGVGTASPGTAAGGAGAPVFLAPRGGMGRLVEALVDELGDAVRTGIPVDHVERLGSRWRVGGFDCDGVVVATPAYNAAQLVEGEAAELLGGIDYASVVLVALAVPRAGIDRELDGSGFLVPQSDGRILTACSWVTSKWGHLDVDPDTVILRASAGRAGDERALDLDDDALVAALLKDLGDTMGLQAAPIDVRVTRWLRSFPQPRPGHRDLVASVRADLPPGLALAGAWVDGVGIPACIRSGYQAVDAALPA